MNKEELRQELINYFNPNGENRRFFDSERFSRICEDIRTIKTSITNLATVKETGDHETRLRELETFKNNTVGRMTAVAAIGSALGAFAMWVLQQAASYLIHWHT